MASELNLGIWGLLVLITGACSQSGREANERLPVYGQQKIVEKNEAGKLSYDTIPHTIADFSFTNQDGETITNASFEGKVYVADFFFTSCPTICPSMKKQMLRVHDRFANHDKVSLLSHTIDPEHDTVALLRDYAERLGVSSDKWHFVTGDMEAIYHIGEKSYMAAASADEKAPGGYIHSGAFILVDLDRRIRGVYDGTAAGEVDLLMNDIDRLLREYELR